MPHTCTRCMYNVIHTLTCVWSVVDGVVGEVQRRSVWNSQVVRCKGQKTGGCDRKPPMSENKKNTTNSMTPRKCAHTPIFTCMELLVCASCMSMIYIIRAPTVSLPHPTKYYIHGVIYRACLDCHTSLVNRWV